MRCEVVGLLIPTRTLLGPALGDRVEGHLAKCAACSAQAEAYDRVVQELAALRAVPVAAPALLAQTIGEYLDATLSPGETAPATGPRGRNPWTVASSLVAAAAGVTGGVALLVHHLRHRPVAARG